MHQLNRYLLAAALLVVVLPGISMAAKGPPDLLQELRTGVLAAGDAAVVVGIQDYHSLPAVPHAGRDASAVYQYLGYTRCVPRDRVTLLTSTPTAAEIQAAVTQAAATVGAEGILWFYFAGHGAVRPDGAHLLLGADAADRANPGDRAVDLKVVLDTMQASAAARGVVLLEAGFAGAPPSAASRDKVTVWAAVDQGENPRSYDLAGHGLFTYLTVGALRGWADGELDGTRDAHVSLREAQTFVTRALATMGVDDQHPTTDGRSSVGDWTLSAARDLEPGPELEGLALLGTTRLQETGVEEVVTEDRLSREEREWRLAEQRARVRSEASRKWQITAELAGAGGEAGKVALEAFLAQYDGAEVEVDGDVHNVEVPEVIEAHELLDGYGATGSDAGGDDVSLDDLGDGRAKGGTSADFLTAEEARELGMGKAEYLRYQKSELPYPVWQRERFSHGGTFQIRFAGFFAIGALDAYYSCRTVIENDQMLAQFWWQSVGYRPNAGGGTVGVGFGVAPVVDVGVEVSLVTGEKYTLNEYRTTDYLENTIGSTQYPPSEPALHMMIQPKARFLVLPYRAFKPYLGFGLAFIVMPGFELPESWAQDRPPGLVFGLEPAVGIQIDTPLGFGFFVEAPFTWYVGSPTAYTVQTGGQEGQIQTEDMNDQYPPCRYLLRVQAGVQIRL